MGAANPDSDQRVINAIAALGAGVAANVALNSKLLRPLITKVDEWIHEGIKLFQDWAQEQNDLRSRRYNHISPEDRFWNALCSHRYKVTAGGLAIGGIVFEWDKIIKCISKLAPKGWAQGLERMLQLRSQFEIIINSPAAVTASVVVALTTVAYGLYVAHGASQQLKELKAVSFQPVKDDFDQALNQLTDTLRSPNASAARVKAAFSHLELAVIAAQERLTSTIRQVTYHHNEALKMKDRAKLVGHLALAMSTLYGAGALFSGVKAAQGGAGVLMATKAALSTKSALLSFLFLAGCASCEYGSHQCQLVIDKCEELQKEAKEMIMTITKSHIKTKENMEVLLEGLEICN
ncbi:unnamed protein product [Rotaria sp. Silwood1]|nr:unnamed protein product [Rotaria sp. Silwood1]